MKRLKCIIAVMRKHRVRLCFTAVVLTAVLSFHQTAWAIYSMTNTVGGYSSTVTAVKDTYYGTGTAACTGIGSYCNC